MKGHVGFWKFHVHPFLLGGTIIEMNPEGLMNIEGYGRTNWYSPVLILPPEEGGRLLGELRELRNQKSQALREFEARWHQQWLDLIARYGSLKQL